MSQILAHLVATTLEAASTRVAARSPFEAATALQAVSEISDTASAPSRSRRDRESAARLEAEAVVQASASRVTFREAAMREGELFAQGATFLASRLGHARQHAIAVLAMAEGDALWAPQANEAMDLVRLLLDASPAVARPVSMLDACAPQEPGRKPSTRADGVRVPRGTTLTPWRERSRLQCSHAVDRTRSIPKPKAVRAVRQAILRPAVTGVMAVGIGMVAGVPATPIQVTTQYASCTVLGFPAQRVSKSFLKPRMALSAFFGSRGVEPIGLKDARLVLGGKRA